MDEMDAMLKTLGTETNNSMVAGISNYAASPPPSPLDADINKRNELREIAASVAAAATLHKGKKKATTVSSNLTSLMISDLKLRLHSFQNTV